MQGQPNLNCKQMEEALDAYYDLELSAEEAEAVELHLADCTICNARLADIDAVVTQLKSLPAVEWSGDLSDAIEARILAQASSLEAKQESSLETKSESKVENIVSINSGSKSQTQSIDRPSKLAGFLKPRYIFASAASILALFFAYSQFASTPIASNSSTVTKVAQTNVLEAVPVEKTVTPEVQVESAHQVAVAEKTDSATTASQRETVKVASAPNLPPQPKAAREETTKETATTEKTAKEKTATEKMLANNKQGDRDHNNNNVNDSEEIVAVYDYDTIDSVSDFGISTNEDGLYAIKL
ncbi:MAG: zf-HC2 domain-containing protein [Candidatus Obscuribacterales bacterium]